MNLSWGLLTFDNVISVTGVLNELVAVRTLLDGVFPHMIIQLSDMTSNKITGMTTVDTRKLKIHTVVVFIAGVTIRRRNWMDTFII